MQTSLYRRWT